MSYVVNKIKRLGQKDLWAHFWGTLKYSFHVIFHPADGFWDLIHEKRGSMSAATFILIMSLLTHIWKLQETSFMFMNIKKDEINVLMECATILLPFLIFCLCNWGVTTLFDGKGKLKDIYMGTAYAFTPYVLIQIPLILLSQFITRDEGTFYIFFDYFSFIWCGILIFMAMVEIHQYSVGKTILFIIGTLFGMLVFIFIMLLFFSVISQAVAYFISLGREILFRLS